MTDINGRKTLNSYGKPINTRQYQYTRADGSIVLIQDHSAGHKFGAKDGQGDQGAHFNLRPIDTPRTGKIPGTKDHYLFKEKK
ncbi:type IV secretion protein Rhs [Pseudomonas tolaasii]|nr:type IV secretion protein Rhs [Pseudomonas tolaasii]